MSHPFKRKVCLQVEHSLAAKYSTYKRGMLSLSLGVPRVYVRQYSRSELKPKACRVYARVPDVDTDSDPDSRDSSIDDLDAVSALPPGPNAALCSSCANVRDPDLVPVPASWGWQ